MSTEKTIITDKKIITDIYSKYFNNGNIFLKTNELNIQVESFSYIAGDIIITAPVENFDIDKIIFYVRMKDDVIFSHAILKSKNEDGTLTFEPVDIQLLKIPRKENRTTVAQTNPDGASTLFISNIISDFIIIECLNSAHSRVDSLKQELTNKLQNNYLNSDIIFSNEKKADQRMLFMKKERRPLFIKKISDANDPEKCRTDKDLHYYRTYILTKEQLAETSKLQSEICVPLLYKFMMPFAYIKVCSNNELNDNDFSIIRKFGMTASTLFTNDKTIIKSSEDKIAVTDLSESGLGIFFKDKTLIKHFKEDSLIVFSLFLPEKKQATMLCIVRNISLIKNYIYRIGCEIINIEAIGEVNYTEYLDLLNKNKQ